MANRRASAKVASFEKGLKQLMGKKYRKLSREDRRVIQQVSRCQEKGGPIGSAAIKDEEK